MREALPEGPKARALVRISALCATLLAGLTLAAAAGAEQDLILAYGGLVGRVTPAPLVATSLPAALGALGEVRIIAGPEGHGRYSLLYNHLVPHPGTLPRLIANVKVSSLGTRSLAAEARSSRRSYRQQATRVRGHPGLLLRARHGSTVALIWSEAGRTYEVGTGTPHAVSAAELQATAGALGHLLGDLTGSLTAADGVQQLGVDALVTEHAVIMRFGWQGACSASGGMFPPTGGSETTVTLALAGQAFTLAPTLVPVAAQSSWEGPWTIGASGGVSPTAGTVTLQGSSEGLVRCTVGPLTSSLSTNPHP